MSPRSGTGLWRAILSRTCITSISQVAARLPPARPGRSCLKGTSKNLCFWAARCDFEVRGPRFEGFAGSSFSGGELDCSGNGVPSAAMGARVVELCPRFRLSGRGCPLQEGQAADVIHEVHQADLCLGSDETDRAHDLAAHAGVLMAEDGLDTRAHFGPRSVRLLRPLR